MKKPLLLSTALALALATTSVIAPSGFAQAQAPAPPSPPPSAQQPQAGNPNAPQAQDQQPRQRRQVQRSERRGFDFTARAEARIAYLKSALKITPEQQAAFDKYAQAIRENATATQQAFQNARDQRDQNQNRTAIDRVEQRAKFAQMRDQQEQRYLAAFRPLYASLSPDQKKVADDLSTPRGRFGRFRGGGPGRG